MILLGRFLLAVGYTLEAVLNVFVFLLIARAVLSWVSPDPNNPIVQFINLSTEPLLAKIRAKIPPLGMLDLSVMVAILSVYFLKIFLAGSILDYGTRILISAGGAIA